jgi:hypothetical protein
MFRNRSRAAKLGKGMAPTRIFQLPRRFRPLYLNAPENVVALTIGKIKSAVALRIEMGGIVSRLTALAS